MDNTCNDTLQKYNAIIREINSHQNQISDLQLDTFQILPKVNECNKQARLFPSPPCTAGGARHKRITKRVKLNYRRRIKSRRNHSCRKQRR
jgi:hypothetical protein